MVDGKSRVFVILIIQGVLVLGFAVVADRLAEIISLRLPGLVSEPNIWLLAGCLVALSAITGFLSLGAPQGADNLRTSEVAVPSVPPSNRPAAPPRPHIVWLLPFAAALGAGIVMLAIILTPRVQFLGSNGYEIITWVIGTAVMAALVRGTTYRTLLPLLAFAFGYAAGTATLILFVRFQENDLSSTIVGWLLVMLTIGGILRIPKIQQLIIRRSV